jgi:hypothetical protein
MNATANPKSKLTLLIGENLIRRLDFHVASKGKSADRSSVLEGLIADHLRLPDDVGALLDGLPSPTRPLDALATRQQRAKDGKPGKTTFYLTSRTARTLKIHADSTGEDRSATAERLIREHIAPWEIYDPREFHLRSFSKSRQGEADEIRSSGAPGN